MSVLREGQKVQIDVVVTNGKPDADGEVEVRMPPDSTLGLVHMPLAALRFGDAGPSYLARREAMVRAFVAAAKHIGFDDDVFVGRADSLLRAIDETPVPEWVGGEHG